MILQDSQAIELQAFAAGIIKNQAELYIPELVKTTNGELVTKKWNYLKLNIYASVNTIDYKGKRETPIL